MKFSGYWVSQDDAGMRITRAVFDETDLDPGTNWTQAWQNSDTEAQARGFVHLGEALVYIEKAMARASSAP